MKCEFCGCENFVAHQVAHMDVLVDGDGNFIDNLSGGVENIYASERPFGPFSCCRCGAEYDELCDGEKAMSGPIEDCLGSNQAVLLYDGSIMFHKTYDSYLSDGKRRVQRWESAEYKVCIDFCSTGYTNISIVQSATAVCYLPNLYVETSAKDDYIPQSVSVQTTSYGTISLDEFRQFNLAMESAMTYAKAIEELFVFPIRDGKFEGGWKPQEKDTDC